MMACGGVVVAWWWRHFRATANLHRHHKSFEQPDEAGFVHFLLGTRNVLVMLVF
jgi:hypothetical protein